MEQLLTARELSEKTGMKVDWILTEWRAGRLPGYRLSYKAIRFRESEVEAWLITKRRGPELPPPRSLRVAPDSMIFDKIIDGDDALMRVRGLDDAGLMILLVTHVQEDQIAKIRDPDRRARIALIPRRVVATHGFILGTSRLGFARLDDSDAVDKIRGDNWEKYSEDALIAVTAAREADVFVTEDKTLATRVRNALAVDVWGWQRFVEEIDRLAATALVARRQA